jgi:hypothetical protein
VPGALGSPHPEYPTEEETMLARVVRLEGADAESIESAAAAIRADSDDGPPEGVPAKEMMLLTDVDGGRTMAIMLFETAEDYAQGDATLESMSPPGDGMGKRTAVERYEVAVRLEA